MTYESNDDRNRLFSILIPVYNEQAYLARVVETALAAPLPENLDREIVLVDDCSTDRTPKVIEELLAKYPGTIRAFRQPKNQGKGAAIRRAIKEMTGDFAIIQDADLEYNPNEYSLVLAPLLDGRADVVYGSRFATRETRKALQYHHKLGNLFLTHLSNFTTGLDLTDMETCYKAFRADALKSIPLRSDRFGIEPEITAKIAKRGWTVYEVPISYNGRRYSEGKKIGWKDGVSAICIILKYWFLDDSFYDEDADSESRQRLEYAKNFRKTLVKRALPHLGSATLEIGAGVGSISRYLPQRERLELVESSERRYNFLRASYDGNAVVDVRRLDLTASKSIWSENEQGAFDSIVCYNRTSELPIENETALANAREALRPNGKLVMIVHAPSKRLSAEKDAKRGFSKREIRDRLENAGFKVEQIKSFAAVERIFRKRDPNKAPSRIGFKLFDLLFPYSGIFNTLLPATRYFVLASRKD